MRPRPLLLALWLVVGCDTANIGEPLPPLFEGAGGRGLCAARAEFLDPAPIKLLSTRALNNTLEVIATDARARFTRSTTAGTDLFDTNASDFALDATLVAHFESVAVAVAQEVSLEGCDNGGDACVSSFIDVFATMAFRRPPTDETRQRLMELYEQLGDDGASHVEAMRGVVTAMLQMPRFLYRIEGTDADGELDEHELAARLSYALTGGPPDAELREAATHGELHRDTVMRAQAMRLLRTDGARQNLRQFIEDWLGLAALDNLVKADPAFGELREAMKEETLAFAEEVVFEREGSLRALLAADFTVVNDALAQFYGAQSPGTGDRFITIALPETRGGLLTHASVLSIHGKHDESHPIGRGLFVQQRILCADFSAVPAEVPDLPEAEAEGTTARDLLRQHNQGSCQNCHRLIDPVGLAFEHYDGMGRHRTVDGRGNAIDASGTIELSDGDVVFADARELNTLLAQDEAALACFAEHLNTFLLGHRAAGVDGLCESAGSVQAAIEGDYSVQDLMLQAVSQPRFGKRASQEEL